MCHRIWLTALTACIPIIASAQETAPPPQPIPTDGLVMARQSPAASNRPAQDGSRWDLTVSVQRFMERSVHYAGNALGVGFAARVFATPRLSLALEVWRPGSFPPEIGAAVVVDIPDAVRLALPPGELQRLFSLGRTEKLSIFRSAWLVLSDSTRPRPAG